MPRPPCTQVTWPYHVAPVQIPQQQPGQEVQQRADEAGVEVTKLRQGPDSMHVCNAQGLARIEECKASKVKQQKDTVPST